MDRRELERAAVRGTSLRGLLAVPAGLLFLATGVANLSEGLGGDPFTFTAIVVLLGSATWAIHRWYVEHFGRVRLSREQQVRYTAASALCFGMPMIAGPTLDFQLDLPVSLFAVLFGLGMLVWFGFTVGLAPYRIAVWGALVVVGLLPVWGGFDDRASVGWLPIGVATIVTGVLDHRALVRGDGSPVDVHVGV